MAGFDFEISIEGEKQFSRRLLIVADGIRTFEKPLDSIGTELLKSFDLNFESRGELFGGWPDRKQDYPWPMLEKTGTMRGGFDKIVQDNAVTVFNPVEWFKYHQSNKARHVLPRRVMMKIDAERKAFIIRAFQSYIQKLKGLNRV